MTLDTGTTGVDPPSPDTHLRSGPAAGCRSLSFWIRDRAPRTDTRTDSSAGHLAPLTGEIGGQAWGGPKHPTADLWAGTLDHVNLHAVLDHVVSIPWEQPDAVQLLAKDEADPYFRLYMIRHGQIRQYSPEPPLEEQDLSW